MKISVIGYSASGKSTFSERLSSYFNIPVLHIDTIYFQQGMVINDKKDTEENIRQFMKQSSWIIDGTYRYLATERYELAEQLFIFKFNRFKALYGMFRRYLKYRGKQRASMADGNPEKLDWGFIKWILHDGRKKDSRKLLKHLEEKYKYKVIVFTKRKQVNKYLKSIGYKGPLTY